MRTVLRKKPRQQWIDALRDGSVQQTRNELAGQVRRGVPGVFCVLGVASEQCRRSVSPRQKWSTDRSAPFFAAGVDLPAAVQERLGIQGTDVRVDRADLSPDLIAAINQLIPYRKGFWHHDSLYLGAMNDDRVPFEVLAEVLDQATVGT